MSQLVKQAMRQILTKEEQLMLNKHLKDCPDCRKMANQMATENERKPSLNTKLTLVEREDLKAQVLTRIREIEPEPRP